LAGCSYVIKLKSAKVVTESKSDHALPMWSPGRLDADRQIADLCRGCLALGRDAAGGRSALSPIVVARASGAHLRLDQVGGPERGEFLR
jgi:hypothetical protein